MNFTVYSKDGCPYCDRIKQVLELAQFSYREYKLDQHFTKQQFQMEFGGDAHYPQCAIGNKHIGDLKETLKYLSDRGMLL